MKVLLIENDVMIISLIERYLTDSIFKLVVTKSYDEAIVAAGESVPDLIVLDFMGKIKSGATLLQTFRNDPMLQFTPIIATAAFVSAKDLQSVINDRLTSILIKPFTQVLFFEALKKCLRHRMVNQLTKNTVVLEETKDDNAYKELLNKFSDIISKIDIKSQEAVKNFRSGPDGLQAIASSDKTKRPSVQERLALIHSIPIKSAMIVDRDQTVLKHVMQQLKQKNVMEIVATKNGDEAWQHYKDEPLDLVILDWDMEGMSALALYNKIRAKKSSRYKPLLILTGRVEGSNCEDVTKEDACVAVIQKPFSTEKFIHSVSYVLGVSITQQEREAATLKCFKEIESEKLTTAAIDEVCRVYPDSERALLKVIDHHILQKEYGRAEIFGRYLLDRTQFDVSAATRLAKIYQYTGRLELAADILRSANIISPDNLSRLLQASEVGLELFKIEDAKTYLGKVLRIDSSNKVAKAGMFVANSLEEYAKTGTDAEVRPGEEKGLLSSLNAIGVNFAKQKQIVEAEKYYSSAMMFVREPMDRAKLAYNFGLAYLRSSNLVRAYKFFEHADKLAGGTFEKARNYLKQLRQNKDYEE